MKTTLHFLILFWSIIQIFVFEMQGQQGTLDSTFGIGGKVITSIGTTSATAHSIAIQNDGKIVVAGESLNGSNMDFALVRYNTDGSLDNTFGNNGIVITDINNSWNSAYSIAIQNDGKILVTGDSDYGVALMRYNTDGSLDTTFGTNGKVLTFVYGTSDVGRSVIIQNDNKILVAGDNEENFFIIRYNPDGTLDNSFGTGGKVPILAGIVSQLNSVVLQNDGKIVVAGWNYSVPYNGNDFVLFRLNTDGTLDNTFGSNGKIVTDFRTNHDDGRNVLIQNDGKIVAVGSSYYSYLTYNWDFALARYNSNGSLDTTFGTSGKSVLIISNNIDFCYSGILQSDGKILAVGTSSIGTNYDFVLVRFNSDGTLDSTFGTNGIVFTDFSNNWDEAHAVALQSDGKIVVAGFSDNATVRSFAVARYNNQIVNSLNSFNGKMSILIFPNPTNNVLKIYHLPKKSQIRIFDVYGKLVHEKIISEDNNTTLQLGYLEEGIYTVQILNNDFLFQKKIIVTK
ncbi:MAG: hypothetical protein KatS3mg027_0640 [Bacteroidia bacterium]|nr:MAG: hypothetical protein KatS3mg027_0640 [Bacteroidia bacterium]